MGKRAVRRAATTRPPATADVPVVGAREPCPCGSGRRYKACHGRAAARAADVRVRRPFEGLPSECDWIALREIVPAATAPLRLAGDPADSSSDVMVTLATVLPMAWPALRRADGSVVLGLQVHGGSGDPSRDAAEALLRALDASPGTPVPPVGLPGPGPRLQEILDVTAPLQVQVHDGFDFWLEGAGDAGPEAAASLERANATVVPTTRLTSVEAAYWCAMRERNHLRWVQPNEEEELLDAMARVHSAGGGSLGAGTRYVGSFRAHGRLVPVWDLPSGMLADDLEDPAVEYQRRLSDAFGADGPLSDVERRTRAGLLSRQVTLR